MTSVVVPKKLKTDYERALEACDEHEKRFGLPVYIPFDPQELLLGYQKRWIADTSPLKIGEKSRRTGITWAEAADAVLTASKTDADGGTNHFYVGSNKEMAREFIDAAAMWAKAFDDVMEQVSVEEEIFIEDGEEGKEILTFVIYFASGFKIQALSSNPSNLRGMQGNVTIDEAAFHERLGEVLKAALALTMWGAKVRLISTHNGVDNLFNQLIEQSRAGKKRYSVHRISIYDACKEGLYQRICQRQKKRWTREAESQWIDDLLNDTSSTDDALEEYCCVPKQGGGAYIPRSLIVRAGVKEFPVIRLEQTTQWNQKPEVERREDINAWLEETVLPVLKPLNLNHRHCVGEDFARVSDLTCIWVGAIQQDLSVAVPLAVELRNIPYRQQEQILHAIIDNLPRFCGAALDATGNGDYLAEQTADKYGTGMVECVKLSDKWYLENMPRVKAAFEDSEIHIPKDEDIVTDLRAIQLNTRGIPRIPEGKTDKEKKRHGDSAIACAMMLYAAQMEGGEIDFTPIPTGTHNPDDLDMDYDEFEYEMEGCF